MHAEGGRDRTGCARPLKPFAAGAAPAYPARMNLRRQPIQRKAVDLQLDGALMADAKALGLDATAVMEEALRRSVAAEKARRWREENAEAIRKSNEEVEKNGLWCDDFRQF